MSGARQFVGRSAELGAIATTCAAARGGESGLIVVQGVAGIGKSALCAQAAESAEQDGFAVGWGRCWGGVGAPPMWPWPDVLSAVGGTAAARLIADARWPIASDADHFALFAAVGDELAARAGEVPVMIVLDDAHAGHVAALLLARYLAGSLERAGVVMLMTRRTDGTPPGDDVAELLGALERDATIVELAPFGPGDTAAFLDTHDVRAEPDMVATLHEVTGGSPLLLSRAVMRAGAGGGALVVQRGIDDALETLRPDDARRDVRRADRAHHEASCGEAPDAIDAVRRTGRESFQMGFLAGIVSDSETISAQIPVPGLRFARPDLALTGSSNSGAPPARW